MSHPDTTTTIHRAMTPEKLALMVELLPTADSLRDIASILSVHLDVVRRTSAPFLALMKLNGTHPQCGCGKDRFHPYGCADSRAKSWPADCLPGCTRAETVVMLERRRVAVDMLTEGQRFCDVDRALGMHKGTAKYYLRYLTPDQLAERERNQRARAADLVRRAA